MHDLAQRRVGLAGAFAGDVANRTREGLQKLVIDIAFGQRDGARSGRVVRKLLREPGRR